MRNKASIKTQKGRVEDLLRRSPYLRDHDHALVASCIIREVGSKEIAAMSAVELLTLLEQGKLPHFESIRRLRQKLQEENPELRGKRYKERAGMEQDIREEVRNW